MVFAAQSLGGWYRCWRKRHSGCKTIATTGRNDPASAPSALRSARSVSNRGGGAPPAFVAGRLTCNAVLCCYIAFFNTERAERSAEAAEQTMLRPAVAAWRRRSACLLFIPAGTTGSLWDNQVRIMPLLSIGESAPVNADHSIT